MQPTTTTTRNRASDSTCSPATVDTHSTTVASASVVVRESTRRAGRGPYDRDVPPERSRSSRSRLPLPGGLAETRRLVRRRGGLVALVCALALVVVGKIVGWVLGGSVGGVASFVSLVMAVPVMPVVGMPAAGGSGRLLIALAASAALWWTVGQAAAGRATRRPVAGWREWSREFLIVGSGVWAGAIGALVLGAIVLGAL